MKYSDLNKVARLSEILSKLEKAKEEAKVFLNTVKRSKNPSGIDGFDSGVTCSLSEYRDGEGVVVNMSGLYVGVEVAEATIQVIENQTIKAKNKLKELGVEF